MKFDHFALNVPDARAMAKWYVENLGLHIARQRHDAPYTTFLADNTGRVIMEIYTNVTAAMFQYKKVHPLSLHVAFASDDPRSVQRRLELVGADLFLEEHLPDGSLLIMMRDPWGIPLQFCRRTKPF